MMSIRSDIRDALDRWGRGVVVPPGHFLRAVLENNLRDAVARADSYNIQSLQAIVQHCYAELPSACWGSADAVRQWERQHYAREMLLELQTLVPHIREQFVEAFHFEPLDIRVNYTGDADFPLSVRIVRPLRIPTYGSADFWDRMRAVIPEYMISLVDVRVEAET